MKKRIRYSDSAILEGLRLNSPFILEHIYKEIFPTIRFLVKQNTGGEEDAKDIFQDALVILYNKLVGGEFELRSSLKTFLYAVCRNLWLQKLESRRTYAMDVEEIAGFLDLGLDNPADYREEEEGRTALFNEHFAQLGEDCQKVLKFFFNKVPLREIANIMGYKSEKYAKTRKYICKEKLKESMQADPRMKEFIYD